MRAILAAAFLAAIALPARADIVDSGALTIGGQAVIGGTFTVQGNAMSVAGSVSATSATLSGSGANIFSLTTSSGIHLLGGKIRLEPGALIQWPDGTTSVDGANLSRLMTPLAWINFDGMGLGSGSQTINASVNVASVTRSGPGLFQVNFSTPSSNGYISCQCSAAFDTEDLLRVCLPHYSLNIPFTATSVFIRTMNNSWTAQESRQVTVTCFGQPTAKISP